ncbi:MAG: hypothetical protein V9E86_11385 [Nitrosomonas sp.]
MLNFRHPTPNLAPPERWLYTAIGKGWGAKDGVAVEKNNQLIANLECQDIPVSKLSEESFTHAGLSAD